MDYGLEVLARPLTGVDRAAAFYSHEAGFVPDVDYHPANNFASSNSHRPAPHAQCDTELGYGRRNTRDNHGLGY